MSEPQDICADLRQRFASVTLGMAGDVDELTRRIDSLEEAPSMKEAMARIEALEATPSMSDAMLELVIQSKRIADALEGIKEEMWVARLNRELPDDAMVTFPT